MCRKIITLLITLTFIIQVAGVSHALRPQASAKNIPSFEVFAPRASSAGVLEGIIGQLNNVKQVDVPARTFAGHTVAQVASTIYAKEGINTYIIKLISMLVSRNSHFTQLIFYEHPNPGDEDVVQIGNSKIIFVPFKMENSQDLQRKLQAYKNSIDLIITHVPFFAEANAASRFARQENIPFMSYEHAGPGSLGYEQEGILKDTLTQNPNTNVLAVSEASKRKVQEESGIDVPVHVVGQMVTMENFMPIDKDSAQEVAMLRQGFGARSEDDILLLAPNTIIPRKQPMDLIKAVDILVNERGLTNVKLAFVGELSFSNQVNLLQAAKDYVREHGLEDNVLFHGPVEQNTLRICYAASDITVLPSRSETFGLVLAEAGLMRKPVVAYNIPGVNEVVSGDVTGILADWSDDPIARIRNLANAIQELCLDPEKRVKIGTAGFHYVHKHFNPNSLIAEHEKLYAEAISTGRNSRYAERAKIPRQSVQKTIGSAA